MNFETFVASVNEAIPPEREKAHADKAETLRRAAWFEWKKLQKYIELKPLGGQQLDNAESTYEDLQKAAEAYFDHLKTAP